MSVNSDKNEGFTLVTAISLPTPWPVRERLVFMCPYLGEMRIEIAWLPDQRIQAVLNLDNQQVRLSETCKIKVTGQGPQAIILSFVLKEDEEVSWHINGHAANASDEDVHAGPMTLARNQRLDLKKDSKGIGTVFDKRKLRLATDNSNATNQALYDGRLWSLFEEEIRHLPLACSRALEHESNDLGHLAVLLRKLLAPGRGNDLLYLCAANVNCPLPVWSRPPSPPNHWTPKALFTSMEEGPKQQMLGAANLWVELEWFELGPCVSHTHCMDLETWMNQLNGGLLNRQTSALGIIKEVADKFGAHADRHDISRLELLRNSSFYGKELATNYLVPLAERIALIGEGIIRMHKG